MPRSRWQRRTACRPAPWPPGPSSRQHWPSPARSSSVWRATAARTSVNTLACTRSSPALCAPTDASCRGGTRAPRVGVTVPRCGGQLPCGAAELVSLVGCGTPDASEWPGAVGWGRAGLRMGVVATTFCSGGRRSDGDRWIIRHLRDAEEGGTGSPVVGYDLPLQQLPVRTYHRGGGCRSGADSGGASGLAGHGGPGGRGAGHDGGQWHLGNRLAPTL